MTFANRGALFGLRILQCRDVYFSHAVFFGCEPHRCVLDMGILDSVYLYSNTAGMKVAVSIPDDVFAEAESLAKDLKASRSEIYSRALGEFLGRHAPDRVTEQMNDVISSVAEGTDDFSRRAARRALRRVEW